MRSFLRFLGWFFALVAAFRAGLAGYAIWLAASRDDVHWDITLDRFLTDHFTALNWAVDLGRSIYPEGLIDSILACPAISALPASAATTALIAYLLLRFTRA